MGSVVGLLTIVLLLVLVARVLLRYEASDADVLWLADVTWIAGSPMVSRDEGDVYARYLERHRLHRIVGGGLGVLVAIVAGVRLYGQVSIGFANSPLADTLFCGVAGVVIGALSAETFRLSEPRPERSAMHSASLVTRDDPALPRVVTAARCLTAVALTVGVVLALVTDDLAPALIATLGAGVVGVAEMTRRAVVRRQRPVLSDIARTVDSRLRAFATSAVAWLELSAASLALGWTVASVAGGATGAGAVLVGAVAVTCLVTAVVALRRAAPRPPRGWTP